MECSRIGNVFDGEKARADGPSLDRDGEDVDGEEGDEAELIVVLELGA